MYEMKVDVPLEITVPVSPMSPMSEDETVTDEIVIPNIIPDECYDEKLNKIMLNEEVIQEVGEKLTPGNQDTKLEQNGTSDSILSISDVINPKPESLEE